ncbi:hypothetical protein J5N97_019332 [Dioscorea zingiberensis]|uniref:RRM domain-containing protein n=1 Tax=Dioscorea zingiberensis TaxID=325984 RepID=A0A9D5HCS2_9LILI|nr:hypothetical protein J5N97_019332 [Dioscorea zingiberensis]
MEEKLTGEGSVPAEDEQKKAVLYVGDLDPSVTEADLIHVFDRFGPPTSARVCRDSATGSSLRYAYLNFPSFPLAEKAIKEMNHTSLNGKPMRIMWCSRDSPTWKSGIGNLFVKNLDVSVDGTELERMFSEYGTVVSCKVAVDEKGKSKGFGFVQMETEEAAVSAIEGLNGKDLKDGAKKLYVSKFVKKSMREGSSEETKYSNLYIKNLESDITDDLLQDKFSEFGKVSSAVVMKHDDGKSKGFGFVSFESPEHAKKAMEAMNGSKLGSKILYVGPAQKKAEREKILKMQFAKKTETVYVKNLDDAVDDKKLLEHFVGCGKVLSARVLRDPNGESRGFGFVRFSSADEASKAIDTLNGSMLNNKALYIGNARRTRPHHFNTFKKFNSVKSLPPQDSLLYAPSYYLPNSQAPFSGKLAHGNQIFMYQQHKYGMDQSVKHSDYQFGNSPLVASYIELPVSSHWSGKGHTDAYCSQFEHAKPSTSAAMVKQLYAQRLRQLAMANSEKKHIKDPLYTQIQKNEVTPGRIRTVVKVGPGSVSA